MPVFNSLRQLACCVARDREEQDEYIELAPLIAPEPNPAAAGPAAPGRPHRDYVEGEARKYWQETVRAGSLVKPDQEELRAAALPVLCAARRRRKECSSLTRAHQGVSAMQLHAAERGWIKHPFTPSEASPDYVEALVQLADDANWSAREIPLPEHPAPRHPPIYYTRNPVTGQPVPRRDAKIRGDYVYFITGRRLTRNDYIHPWPGPPGWPLIDDIDPQRAKVCYSLVLPFRGKLTVMLHWKIGTDNAYLFSNTLDTFHFSPYPPVL